MKINLEKTDELTAVLELKLEKSDYDQEYIDELKKFQKTAALKGFRKGKAPMGFIKKMYGKSVLADKVNKKLQEALFGYLKDEKIEILGEPLPHASQEEIEFDEKEPKDYTFKFDLGLSPQFDVQGVSSDDSYDRARVDVSAEMINEEVENYRKRLGTMEVTDAAVEENDMIVIQAEELEGTALKENGHACEFTVSVNFMDEAYTKAVTGLKKTDTFDFDIYKIEKDKTEAHVKKYLLQSEDEDAEIGNMFRGTISEVKRLKVADLDQDFYDKLFGKDEITSKEAFEEKIKENIQNFYNQQCDSLMHRAIMDILVEKNTVALPEAFLKRWLNETNKEHTAEQIDADFSKFTENLIWTMIKNKLSDKFKVEVTPEELQVGMGKRVQSYFGGNMSTQDAYFGQIVNQMLQDKQQVQALYAELEATKIFKEVEKEVKLVDNVISLEEYKAQVEQVNKQYNK